MNVKFLERATKKRLQRPKVLLRWNSESINQDRYEHSVLHCIPVIFCELLVLTTIHP